MFDNVSETDVIIVGSEIWLKLLRLNTDELSPYQAYYALRYQKVIDIILVRIDKISW